MQKNLREPKRFRIFAESIMTNTLKNRYYENN